MSDNFTGSLIGLIGIILALVTHMMIKELSYDVDFLMILLVVLFSLPLLLRLQLLQEKQIFTD